MVDKTVQQYEPIIPGHSDFEQCGDDGYCYPISTTEGQAQAFKSLVGYALDGFKGVWIDSYTLQDDPRSPTSSFFPVTINCKDGKTITGRATLFELAGGPYGRDVVGYQVVILTPRPDGQEAVDYLSQIDNTYWPRTPSTARSDTVWAGHAVTFEM